LGVSQKGIDHALRRMGIAYKKTLRHLSRPVTPLFLSMKASSPMTGRARMAGPRLDATARGFPTFFVAQCAPL
jgi:hypothetical protein